MGKVMETKRVIQNRIRLKMRAEKDLENRVQTQTGIVNLLEKNKRELHLKTQAKEKNENFSLLDSIRIYNVRSHIM